jgi:hypothetical protein
MLDLKENVAPFTYYPLWSKLSNPIRLQKSCHSHPHYIPKKPPNYASKAKRDTPPKSHKSTKELNAPWVKHPPKKKAHHCKYGVSYKRIVPPKKKATNSFIVSQHTLSASWKIQSQIVQEKTNLRWQHVFMYTQIYTSPTYLYIRKALPGFFP